MNTIKRYSSLHELHECENIGLQAVLKVKIYDKIFLWKTLMSVCRNIVHPASLTGIICSSDVHVSHTETLITSSSQYQFHTASSSWVPFHKDSVFSGWYEITDNQRLHEAVSMQMDWIFDAWIQVFKSIQHFPTKTQIQVYPLYPQKQPLS